MNGYAGWPLHFLSAYETDVLSWFSSLRLMLHQLFSRYALMSTSSFFFSKDKSLKTFEPVHKISNNVAFSHV